VYGSSVNSQVQYAPDPVWLSSGNRSSKSCRYICTASPIWRMLLRHCVCRAFSRACANTGNRIAAKIAIIAITTSSSISVKPSRRIGITSEVRIPPSVRSDKGTPATLIRRARGWAFAGRIPPLPALFPLDKGGEGKGEGGFHIASREKFPRAPAFLYLIAIPLPDLREGVCTLLVDCLILPSALQRDDLVRRVACQRGVKVGEAAYLHTLNGVVGHAVAGCGAPCAVGVAPAQFALS
jgi:hypothetical protein